MQAPPSLKSDCNQVALTGFITEMDALRYSPAGIAVRELKILHESEQLEAGIMRKVRLILQAKMVGDIAAAEYPLNQQVRLIGFLNLKHPRYPTILLHIQEIYIL